MPRPREFDRDTVLTKAMETFWSQGFEATSLEDLVKSMGIGRQSLYDTFGDKRQLFLEALRFYRDSQSQGLASLFATAPSVRKAFKDLFESPVHESEACSRRGCLLINSATELAARDAEAKSIVAETFRHMENVFASALSRGKEQGEFAPALDSRATARFLVAALLGLRVIAKTNPDPATLRDIARLALGTLR